MEHISITELLNNPSVVNEVNKIRDLENFSNLCDLKKKKELLFDALLDELMNEENNNVRYQKNDLGYLASLELEKKLENLKEEQHRGKLCLQNNSLNITKHSQLPKKNGIHKKSMEIHSKNILYSIIEAEQVMCHATRHLSTLITSIAYVRLRVQTHPENVLLEGKHTRIAELNSFTEKAIYQTQLLHDELKFLHQYNKKLEEKDEVIPADMLIEKKESNYSGKLATVGVIAAAFLVILFNNRYRISMF